MMLIFKKTIGLTQAYVPKFKSLFKLKSTQSHHATRYMQTCGCWPGSRVRLDRNIAHVSKHASAWSATSCRLMGSKTGAGMTTAAENSQGFLPAPPDAVLIPEELTSLGEPTLSSLGLCSWWPSGWVQSLLESIHVYADVPWLGSIVLLTVLLRTATIPLTIMQLKTAALMNNHMPTLLKLQTRMLEAKQANDLGRFNKEYQEFQDYQKRNKCSPMTMMLRPMMAAPVFFSVFHGIKGMTGLPVQSMVTGGAAWFMDLTAPDPFLILPALSASTIFLVTRTGAEGVTQEGLPKRMQFIINIMPLFIFGVTAFQPSALALYWSTSNIISLIFSRVFRTQYMRNFFNIPSMIKHPPQEAPPLPFSSGFKEYSRLTQLAHEMEDRKQVGALKFKQEKTIKGESRGSGSDKPNT